MRQLNVICSIPFKVAIQFIFFPLLSQEIANPFTKLIFTRIQQVSEKLMLHWQDPRSRKIQEWKIEWQSDYLENKFIENHWSKYLWEKEKKLKKITKEVKKWYCDLWRLNILSTMIEMEMKLDEIFFFFKDQVKFFFFIIITVFYFIFFLPEWGKNLIGIWLQWSSHCLSRKSW